MHNDLNILGITKLTFRFLLTLKITEPIRFVIVRIMNLGVIKKDRVNRGLVLNFPYGVCEFLTNGLDAALDIQASTVIKPKARQKTRIMP